MNEQIPLKTTDTSIVYENPWIKVREDRIVRSSGDTGVYSYLEFGQSSVVVAVDDKDRICIVQSYRHPFGEWYWELPGGGGDGEDIVIASKRELKEEAGVAAEDWKILGKARVCNGLSTEWQVNLLATNLSYGEFTQQEDETRARRFVPLDELEEMIRRGEFADNQSLTALYMYKLWLGSEQMV